MSDSLPRYVSARPGAIDENGGVLRIETDQGIIDIHFATSDDADALSDRLIDLCSDIEEAVYEADIQRDLDEGDEDDDDIGLEMESMPESLDVGHRQDQPIKHDASDRGHAVVQNPMRSRHMVAIGLILCLVALFSALVLATLNSTGR